MTSVTVTEVAETPPRKSKNALSSGPMLWLGLVSVVVTGLVYAFPKVSFSSLRLLDVDGYMRAQRVLDLLVGNNGWFDSFVHRGNAPFGHSLHWTRPVDLLLLALSWPFTLFNEPKQSVYLGSFVFGLVMVVLIFFAVAWAARALIGRGASYLAAGATAFQLGLVAYNSPGHPDHHGMILLLTAILIGLTLRLLQTHSLPLAVWAGVVGGLGIWVATEFLFPLAACLVSLVCRWIATSKGLASLRVMTTSLVVSLAVAVVIERDPGSWLAFESDRVSAIHLIMGGLLAIAAWGFGRLEAATVGRRMLIAIISAGVAAALLEWIFAGFFRGPVEAIEPSVDRFFDEYVTELAPTWHSVGRQWAGIALVLGAPFLAAVHVIDRLRAHRGTPLWSGWALLCVWSVFSFGLALASFRYVPVAELLVGIPLAAAAEQRLSRARESQRSILRPLFVLWCLLGYLVLVVAGNAFAYETSLAPPANCNIEQIEGELETYVDTASINTAVVLATVPSGPELMWRLNVEVVGTPYHSNIEGIEFTQTIFGTENLEVALALLDSRGIDVIVVCEGEAGSAGYRGDNTFYDQLLAGDEIRGWTELQLSGDSAFRVYLRS